MRANRRLSVRRLLAAVGAVVPFVGAPKSQAAPIKHSVTVSVVGPVHTNNGNGNGNSNAGGTTTTTTNNGNANSNAGGNGNGNSNTTTTTNNGNANGNAGGNGTTNSNTTTTPPGQGGTPPGQVDNTSSGSNGSTNTPPGQGGTPPGQVDNTTSNGTSNGGGTGVTPPGQGGTPPGQVDNPSSSNGTGPDTTPPGQGGTPPGQVDNPSTDNSNGAGPNTTPPGQGGTPPGQVDNTSSQGGNNNGGGNGTDPNFMPPGQGGTPPGQDANPGNGNGPDSSNAGGNGNGNSPDNSNGANNPSQGTDNDVPDPYPDFIIDLTTHGASGVGNGAIYSQEDFQPTGTGVFLPFLRIQETGPDRDGVEVGYNTDARPVDLDTKDNNHWTHSLTSDGPEVVTSGGNQYLAFRLDVNEQGSPDDRIIWLNRLEIYLGDSPDLLLDSPGGLGTKVYDLDQDARGDGSVKLDYRLGHGSGSGDMQVLIPLALFQPNKFIYLLSEFSGADAGFEEWSARVAEEHPGTSVPLPAVVWGGLSLLSGVGATRVSRWKRNRGETNA